MSGKPRLLDAFCKAGGASKGYADAGFEVVGVDIEPQENYPFEFIEADALEVLADLEFMATFDCAVASPPCQNSSSLKALHRDVDHPELIPPTRELLKATGLPYVIENVVGADLVNPTMLCGSSFGLDVRRHRLFETNFPMMSPGCCHGVGSPRFRSLDKRQKTLASVVGVHGHLNFAGEREIRERAMQIDWMTPAELAQAVPPAYTAHIGEALQTHLAAQRDEVAA